MRRTNAVWRPLNVSYAAPGTSLFGGSLLSPKGASADYFHAGAQE
jgi:hypothetical protein